MYLRYFALQDHPFAITPDPAFLFLSAHHREALGHLVYGTGEYGGFVELTGEVGTGKTTLIRALLEQQHEVADVDVALCLNPQLTVNELLASICDELGVKYAKNRELSRKNLVDKLNDHLLEAHASGRRTVLIIDEAQNLSAEVLEQVRLLTNLETGKHKLLRIILVGQPELEAILARPDLRQLAQRITARYHLPGLNRHETQEYIRHRLRVAGGDPKLFPQSACAAVYHYSRGTPRLINTICERALMGAYARETHSVGRAIVRQAARETLPRAYHAKDENLAQQFAPVAVLLSAALLAFGVHYLLIAPATSSADVASQPDAEVAQGAPGAPKTSPQDTAGEATAAGPGQTPAPQPDYELPEGDASMGQLLRLWGVFGAEVDVECRNLRIGDLRCLQDTATLEKLATFNHPALLTLRQGNSRRQVLLSNLTDETATFVFAQGTRQWPREELARLWTGEFRMIWRLHASTRRIGEGSVGDSVVWLRQRLAAAEGVNLDAKAGQPSPVFDSELAAALRQFQRARGLEADGLVGARTMIMLESVSPAPGTPVLNAGRTTRQATPQAASAQAASAQAATSPVCSPAKKMPATRELARLSFAANATELSPDTRDRISRLAETLGDDAPAIYVTGTAYNPTRSSERLHELARLRAHAVARVLVDSGLASKDINCLVATGKAAPSADQERAAIIYQALDAQ